jgi:hypothetical protein
MYLLVKNYHLYILPGEMASGSPAAHRRSVPSSVAANNAGCGSKVQTASSGFFFNKVAWRSRFGCSLKDNLLLARLKLRRYYYAGAKKG